MAGHHRVARGRLAGHVKPYAHEWLSMLTWPLCAVEAKPSVDPTSEASMMLKWLLRARSRGEVRRAAQSGGCAEAQRRGEGGERGEGSSEPCVF